MAKKRNDRKKIRHEEALNRLNSSDKRSCGHLHTTNEQTNRCPSFWNK